MSAGAEAAGGLLLWGDPLGSIGVLAPAVESFQVLVRRND